MLLDRGAKIDAVDIVCHPGPIPSCLNSKIEYGSQSLQSVAIFDMIELTLQLIVRMERLPYM